MATFTKFEIFSEDLAKKVHNLHSDTLNVYLSNDAPVVATDALKSNVTEIGTGNGYTGPIDTQNTVSRSGGTTSVVGVDPSAITASGGTIGPFQYVVLYNDSSASPLDPLIGYWDYGSPITLQIGESFTIDFGASLFTIA